MRSFFFVLTVSLAFMNASAWAQNASVTHTFQANTPAKASEVNQNFQDLVDEINALKQELNAAKSEIATLKGQSLASHVSVRTVDGYPTVWIEGANLQVVSGEGTTDGDANPQANTNREFNGLGNVIIGYNESDFLGGSLICTVAGYVTQADCENAGGVFTRGIRSGSHNLIVGANHSYSGHSGIVSGERNTIGGHGSSVIAAQQSSSSGDYSVVVTGWKNSATGPLSAVIAGGVNDAIGSGSVIAGGSGNNTLGGGVDSSIFGGNFNKASKRHASVFGGANNHAIGEYSVVIGGGSNSDAALGNQASGDYSVVVGGQKNRASGQWAGVLGGGRNIASGTASVVSGGGSMVDGTNGNEAKAKLSSVSGGTSNTAGASETTGIGSSVSGGFGVTETDTHQWRAGDVQTTSSN